MQIDPDALGEELFIARRDRVPVAPLTERFPDITVDDAYAVQGVFARRIAAEEGASVSGYKLGLTSKPMQELLGLDQPDYGPVLSTMVYDDHTEIPVDRFIHPKVEAELAVILGEDLTGPGVTTLDASRAISGAVAAIELVDSRIVDWRIGLCDTVADLASCGAITLAGREVPVEGWEPRLVGMTMFKNGEMVATGAGAAALGDPVAAVAWLANTLGPYGVTIEAGQFVMTGSLHAAFDVAPGDTARAEFDRLGPVTMRFV